MKETRRTTWRKKKNQTKLRNFNYFESSCSLVGFFVHLHLQPYHNYIRETNQQGSIIVTKKYNLHCAKDHTLFYSIQDLCQKRHGQTQTRKRFKVLNVITFQC